MTEFIILSRVDMLTLCNDKPVTVYIDKKPYMLCTDEYFTIWKKTGEQEPCEEWYDVPSDEMTLEQARQAVKDLRKKLAEHLDQEPCEDCISRQAAIDALSHMCSEDENGITVSRANVNSVLKAMPPVTPKPKMGRWIDEGFYAEGHSEHAYRCSECDEHYIGYVGEFKHCPNCGATMKGESK